MNGKLYLVATPIGNLEDITSRAIKTLENVDLVVCEDTRRTGLLLSHFKIKKPLLPFFEENELRQLPKIIERLKKSEVLALVTDAGTPTISDPGFRLVRECIGQNIEIEAIPGPTAVVTALSVSGLPTNRFLFLGYLPEKQGKRRSVLSQVCQMQKLMSFTVIFFESPHRLLKTLADILEICGDYDIVIARELTKIHEEVRREKVSQAIKHFSNTPPKGEFTLLF